VKPTLTIEVLPERYAVCRLEPQAPLPRQVLEEPFFAVVRTGEELSIVMPEARAVQGGEVEDGWRALKVLGPLDFSMIGVLSSIAAPLADAQISIFVFSTYETDYLMLKAPLLGKAVQVLRASGFAVVGAV